MIFPRLHNHATSIRQRLALRHNLVSVVVLSGALFLGFGTAQEVEWGYEGANGPTAWGSLDETFALCAEGQRQSPVNIVTADTEPTTETLSFDYPNAPTETLNNGHTVEALLAEGDELVLDGEHYSLEQFHFHAPSEHTLNGTHAAAEIHFVHQNADGAYAVVGVFVRAGKANPVFTTLLPELPTKIGDPVPAKALVKTANLLPKNGTVYRYQGSLTTPPCSQGVTWLLMANPVTMSPAQLEALDALIAPNNRPVQALHGRSVLRSQ